MATHCGSKQRDRGNILEIRRNGSIVRLSIPFTMLYIPTRIDHGILVSKTSTTKLAEAPSDHHGNVTPTASFRPFPPPP